MLSFGQRLYELRTEKKISQQRLAVDLGIEQTSISCYENNRYLPTVEMLVRIGEYFDVSIDYLLGLADNRLPAAAVKSDLGNYAALLFEALPAYYKERAIGYMEALKSQSFQ